MPQPIVRPACRLAAYVLLSAAAPAVAQVDQLSTVIGVANATGGSNSLGAYAYDPTTDTAYTATFGSGAALRRITGVGTAQASSITVNEGAFQGFYRDGDPTRSVTTPVINGMVFNPAAVGGVPAYGNVWINESALTRLPGGSSTTDPAATKRIYRYNLLNAPAVPPAGYDGRDVFASVATLAQLQSAAGTTNTTSNLTRQSAFSPTGRTLYSVDSSIAFGGLYKFDPVAATTTRIVTVGTGATGEVRLNTEPAVIRIGDADRILFRGNTAGGNVGGVNYVDHDGTTTTAQQVFVTRDELAAFLERPAATPDVSAIATDAAGTLYIYDSDSNVLIRRDAQGRMSKVTTRNERDLAFTGVVGTAPTPNANILRMQPRTIQHPTAGAVTQVLYAELTPLNFVAGATVFQPGDFDRDGGVDAADLDLFEAKLTVRGASSPLADAAKFDMNGNQVIDFADVKIVQRFAGFLDGDADFDGTVNFPDLLALASNYNGTGKVWTQGDFTGDDAVNFPDLLLLASNYNQTSGGGIIDGGPGAFAADWARALATVPEPGLLALVPAAALLASRRRRS